MRLPLSTLVPALLLALAAVAGPAMAWPPWRNHKSVNIRNELGDETTPLRLHCKSGDDDLGEHTVTLHQQYGFGFYPDFGGTTLFWCGFRWGGRWQNFTVWKDIGPWGNKKRLCNQCVYRVQADGFFVSEGPAGPYMRVQDWK